MSKFTKLSDSAFVVSADTSEGPCQDPQAVSYELRDLRERCVHAALHPNFPPRPLRDVLADAREIEAYLNGVAK